MIEGSYLGRPPVDLPRSRSRTLLFRMVRGVDAYSMGAGGFGTVPAMPANLQNFRAPAGTQRLDQMKLTELYANQPGLFKAQLQRRFSEPRSMLPMGFRDTTPTFAPAARTVTRGA